MLNKIKILFNTSIQIPVYIFLIPLWILLTITVWFFYIQNKSFVFNSWFYSLIFFFIMIITGRIIFRLPQIQYAVERYKSYIQWVFFFIPLIFVIIHFLSSRYETTENITGYFLLISCCSTIWFFYFIRHKAQSDRLKNIPVFYLFYYLFLLPFLYAIYLGLSGIHIGHFTYSPQKLSYAIFFFFTLTTLARTYLNYNLVTKIVPKSIEQLKLYLLVSPTIFMIITISFMYQELSLGEFSFDLLLWYGDYLLWFWYFSRSNRIKQLYFYQPHYDEQVKNHFETIQNFIAQGQNLRQAYYSFFSQIDRNHYSFERFEYVYQSLII
jgi:hypothetical protein